MSGGHTGHAGQGVGGAQTRRGGCGSCNGAAGGEEGADFEIAGCESGRESDCESGDGPPGNPSERGSIELQAASTTASRIAPIAFETGRTMWVIFLEMAVALGLLLLIVWWTWPKKRPEDEDKP